MHVDTMDTHAVSGIINVDQDVHSPWMLEVRDRDTSGQIMECFRRFEEE